MNGFYQRLRQLHLILGLAIGLLLWLIVFAGSLSFYRAELDSWQLAAMAKQQPVTKEQLATKVQAATKAQDGNAIWPEPLPTAQHSAALALTHLQQKAPDAKHWYIELPQPRSPYLKLHWQQQGERPQLYQQFLQPETGEALQDPLLLRFGATEHQLGGWFFQLHYNLLQLAGSSSRTLVAFVALLWLLLSISGLFSLKGHWRSLFKPGQQLSGQSKKLQRHHQLALFTLPFALLFASTGWLTQMFSENSAPQQVLYPDNPYQFYSELFPMQQPPIKAEGALHALPDLKPMLQAAGEAFAGAEVGKISISAPGRSNSTVLLSSSAHSRIGNQASTLLFQLQPGAGNKPKNAAPLVWQQTEMAGTASPGEPQTHSSTQSATTPFATMPLAQLRQLAYGLHQSLYANDLLRFLLFVSGLLCCWMIWLGLKAALHRLAAGRWQRLLLLHALPGSVVLASVMLILQSGLWPLTWSLSSLFLLYWGLAYLLLLGWSWFRLWSGAAVRSPAQ